MSEFVHKKDGERISLLEKDMAELKKELKAAKNTISTLAGIACKQGSKRQYGMVNTLADAYDDFY